jgi:hypothetical protein
LPPEVSSFQSPPTIEERWQPNNGVEFAANPPALRGRRNRRLSGTYRDVRVVPIQTSLADLCHIIP